MFKKRVRSSRFRKIMNLWQSLPLVILGIQPTCPTNYRRESWPHEPESRSDSLFLAARGDNRLPGLRSEPDRGLEPALLATVPGRDHPPVLTGARDTIEHPPGGERNLADCFFSVAFAAQISGHHAENVRSVLDKDYT